MDGHSKSEVLEIFNMNLKNVIARFAQVCVLFITFACVVLMPWEFPEESKPVV